jgi:flagellar protein FliO/FliZ
MNLSLATTLSPAPTLLAAAETGTASDALTDATPAASSAVASDVATTTNASAAAVATAAAPTTLQAATLAVPAAASAPSMAGSFASMAGSLAMVLLIIFAFAWLMRWMQGIRQPRGGSLRVEAGLQLGAKERVLVLQAGDARLLLGVSAGRISLLHHFTESAVQRDGVETPSVQVPPMPQVNISPFAEQMRKLFATK